MNAGSRWEAVGAAIFRVALHLLPRWLRERAGDAMAETFLERQRRSLTRYGHRSLPGLWLREIGGLIHAAVAARASGTAPDSVVHDLRSGARALTRRPSTTLLVTATIGLGVGVSTAMFSVVDTLLLRPLPYPDAERLVRIYPTVPSWREIPALADEWRRGRFDGPAFAEWGEAQTSFEATGAVRSGRTTLTRPDGPPLEISVAHVTPGTLELFTDRTLLGRTFTKDDLAAPRVVVLGHDLWTSRFGGDRGLVGETVRLSDRPYTVVGVLPPGVRMPEREAELYLPFDPSGERRNQHNVDAFGRLAEGVDVERARAEAAAILAAHRPPEHTEHTAFVVPVQDDVARAVRTPVLILLGASGLLLVVALGNVATILLGAGVTRVSELGIRRALGADRKRIVRQLLTEAIVPGLLGALLGALIAALGVRALIHLAPGGFPGLDRVAVDGRILAVAVILSVVGALLAGLFPALSLTGGDLGPTVDTRRSVSRPAGRLQTAVVVGELTLATVLLGGAGLLTRTLLELRATDTGFDAETVLLIDLSTSLRYQRLAEADPDGAFDDLRTFVTDVREALASLPGVEHVAASSDIPLGPYRANNSVWPTSRDLPEEERPVAERRAVTADYFETLGIDIVDGRALTAQDDRRDAEPTAVVSEGLAEALWPGERAVGKTLGLYAGEYRVVGVARNLRDEALVRPSELAFYVPASHIGSVPTSFFVRASSDDPTALAEAVRERIWSVQGDVPIRKLQPMEEVRAAAMDQERYRARLMLVFAGFAALLSLMGVYGVTNRAVSRRRRELGIRMALGAVRSRIHRLVLRDAVVLGVGGVLLGLGGILLSGRILEGFLFGTSPRDPLVLTLVPAAVLLAVLCASLGPARRATRVDPVESLRME